MRGVFVGYEKKTTYLCISKKLKSKNNTKLV